MISMMTLDYAIIILLLISIGINIYIGSRYREYFVVDQTSMTNSYWSMITAFRKAHPRAGMSMYGIVIVQIMLVVALALRNIL
jgi:hypothetical protein